MSTKDGLLAAYAANRIRFAQEHDEALVFAAAATEQLYEVLTQFRGYGEAEAAQLASEFRARATAELDNTLAWLQTRLAERRRDVVRELREPFHA